MATQGPLYPGAVTSVANVPTSENSDAWVNPGNVSADDGTESQITAATYDTPDISQRLTCKSFGFTIPAGSTIDGITVEIDRRSIILNSGKDFRVQLLDAAGALVGANKAATATIWPTTSAVASYGGVADTWTASPDVAMVNDPDFGVVLSAQANIANADIGVDYVRITVTYTPPAFTTFERAAAIDGVAAVASAGTFFSILEAAAALSATGAIASSGMGMAPPVERSAALAATGSIATVGQRELQRQAVLAATGAVQAVGVAIHERSAALASTGVVVSAGQRDLLRSAAVGATAIIASSGQIAGATVHSRSAALGATAGITSVPQRELGRAAILAAVTGIATTGAIQTIHARSVALGAVASITVLVPSLTEPGTIDHGGSKTVVDQSGTKTVVDESGAVTIVEGARTTVVIE